MDDTSSARANGTTSYAVCRQPLRATGQGAAADDAAAAEPTPAVAAAAAAGPLWREPLPLASEVEAARFPLSVLPQPLLPFLHEVAAASNCPVDLVAVPLLTLAGAAIGASRALEIKPGWAEFPCLWSVIISPPGNRKSAALKYCSAPFFNRQKELLSAFKTTLKEWTTKTQNQLDKDPRPELLSVYCKDVTREQLCQLLGKEQNWRGFPRIHDEIMGFINSMDEYRSGGKGGDRQFHLDLWNCGQTRSDRRNLDDPNILTEPVAPLTGGTQPSKLPDLRGRGVAEDGFIDRFLPAFPRPLPPLLEENWLAVSRKTAKSWAGVVEFLWALAPNYHGNTPAARVVKLTESGRAAWVKLTRYLSRLMYREDLLPVVHNTLWKLQSYGVRLALIVHFLRLACKEVEYEDVDGDSVKRATQLVAYFFSHVQKLHAAIESDVGAEQARRILRCLERHSDLRDFTRADLYRYVRTSFQRVNLLDLPLRVLCEYGYLWAFTPDAGGRPGPNSRRYLVNPRWSGFGRQQWAAPVAAAVERLDPPPFELTAAGLCEAWRYICTRRLGAADEAGSIQPRLAELLRRGFPAAALLTAILDERRDRSEHYWQFEERINRGQLSSEARREEAEAQRLRMQEEGRRMDQEQAQAAARWAGLTEEEKTALRRRARAGSETLRRAADNSPLLVAACLRIALDEDPSGPRDVPGEL